MSSIDLSTKLLNTAIIATKLPKLQSSTEKLSALVETPAFQTILKCIQDLATKESIPEEQAAEQVVETFRQLDQIWDAYIFQEGLSKLKAQLKPSQNN